MSLIDNVEDIHVIDHQIQLRTRSVVGDMIVSSRDHRILTCHNGAITHELSTQHLITSILSYRTIENDQLFLCISKDLQCADVFQYDSTLTLTPFINSQETADCILIDDFTRVGWKQILFLKNHLKQNSFTLTDFSQINVFQQESDYGYHVCAKVL